MSRRKWFRVYHGLNNDVSLAVAANTAGITRNDMTALWLYLLDHASRTTPPGSIAACDADEAALLLHLSPANITAAIAALRQRKKIDQHMRIIGWDKYQPSSTQRVRAHRARRKVVTRQQTPRDIDHDSPAAIAARRARLQHNNALIIGQPSRDR